MTGAVREGGPRPRVVATDCDGTLLRSDGSVSPRTRRALARAEEAGLQVVLVTARPPRWMHDLADVVAGHGTVICANGAFVYDLHGRTITREELIEPALVAELARDLRRALPGIVFSVETAAGWVREGGFVSGAVEPEPGSVVVATPEAAGLDAGGVGKLLARHPSMESEAFIEAVREEIGDRAVLAYSGASGLAEISAAGVTKAAALARFCAGLQVDATQVWAFGDMPNDIPMLEWAGRGIVVANGHPQALAAADEVCPANDEDGVAAVLERLLD